MPIIKETIKNRVTTPAENVLIYHLVKTLGWSHQDARFFVIEEVDNTPKDI